MWTNKQASKQTKKSQTSRSHLNLPSCALKKKKKTNRTKKRLMWVVVVGGGRGTGAKCYESMRTWVLISDTHVKAACLVPICKPSTGSRQTDPQSSTANPCSWNGEAQVQRERPCLEILRWKATEEEPCMWPLASTHAHICAHNAHSSNLGPWCSIIIIP